MVVVGSANVDLVWHGERLPAWAISRGERIENALRLACAAGPLSTGAVGARTALPTADDVYAWLTA